MSSDKSIQANEIKHTHQLYACVGCLFQLVEHTLVYDNRYVLFRGQASVFDHGGNRDVVSCESPKPTGLQEKRGSQESLHSLRTSNEVVQFALDNIDLLGILIFRN